MTSVQVTKVPPNVFALYRVQLKYLDWWLACKVVEFRGTSAHFQSTFRALFKQLTRLC